MAPSAARLRALVERWTTLARRVPIGRERALAGGLVLAGAVVAVVVGRVVFPFHSVNHDEGVYLAQAAMLLDGQLFVDPPVGELFRPWFFTERPDGTLYPKYAPVPAATFALGWLAGSPRFGLVAVTAVVVLSTYALGATLFDRRTGLIAAAVLFVSPLFLLHSGVFLPYAPTAVWNLLFVYAYVRADRDRSRRWAAVAGVAVGVAFFSRPYTAVAFAAPFVCHAVWSLRGRVGTAGDATLLGLHRPTVTRQSLTAVGGVAGVAVALVYNAVVTGDPLVFPYEAFAPRDGIGFGEREILGYERAYTPALGVRANAEVVWRLATRWVPAGAVGTLFALVGVARLRETTPSRTRTHRFLLAGTVVSVVLANVAFWGNLNVLGDLALPADGLIASLGPYYHYDLVVPTAVFAAVGLRRSYGRLASGGPSAGSTRSVAVAVGLATLVVAAGVAVTAPPVERNTDATRTYQSAYAPFTGAGGDASDTAQGTNPAGDWARDAATASTDAPPPFARVGRPALTTPADAVVLLPRPFGDWLAHPYQPLRNDPGFDAATLYALDERPFAVADAAPDRRLYRYVSRGEWAPSRGTPVAARLQPVTRQAGDRVRLGAGLDVPRTPDSVSVRLAAGGDQSYYAARPDGDRLDLTLTLDGTEPTGDDETAGGDGGATTGETATVRLAGPVEAVGDATNLTVAGRETVSLTVFLDYGPAGGTGYRLRLPVAAGTDRVRAVTPRLSVCRQPAECGDEAGYVPRDTPEGVAIDTTLSATNGSTASTSRQTTPTRPRRPAAVRVTRSHDGEKFSSVAVPTGVVQSHQAPDRVLGRDD